MRENNSSEAGPISSAHENNTDTESKTRILTQKVVNEKMKNHIAPLIRRLQDLIRLIQCISTGHRSNFSLQAGTSANSSAAVPSPDIVFLFINLVLSFSVLQYLSPNLAVEKFCTLIISKLWNSSRNARNSLFLHKINQLKNRNRFISHSLTF